MKRISIVIALTLLIPIASQARSFGSQRQRIRYSPYAFSYHNSGLVPGGVKYSPYAFSPRHSGLVYQGTRYTPYAFNYHKSGLVVDYYWWQAPVCTTCPCQTTIQCAKPTPRSMRPQAVARRKYALSSAQRQEIRATDGLHVIRRYLKERGLNGAEISHRLSVKSQTATVAFIFRDRNVIVRYSNPEIIETLASGSAAQQKAYERHEQRWQALAAAFQNQGGNVYCVNTADREQIVAALDDCSELTANPTTLYAKN